ncbi:MAG TPA: ABC transporter permease [Ktedonobacteraceae bacterium]|nr:ABC transporter permease [Ktedonobacteraceae bacterium]
MVQFFIKRFIGLIFVVFGVTFITFIMGYIAPGDPIVNLLGQHYTQSAYIALKHSYGLDLPWYTQYYNFIVGMLHLDFGRSFEYKDRAVWDILKEGVPISAELGMWALFLQVAVGVPLGIISALKANTWIDTTNMAVMLTIYAIPSFILAVFAQVILVQIDLHTNLQWPVSNWGVPWHYTWTDIQFKIVPILVYAGTGLAYFARLSRTTMLEVLRQDYVRTARAKGMRERVVVYRHALRNALIPLVTIIGLSIGFLVTGAFFIEEIFNIPGIAQITLTSISYRDYPVIQATTVLLAVAVVLGNLLSDILYTIVDPRIKAS